MANLIVTVIAIALVAVASLMGAYYGGSAFLSNSSAAVGTSVLNEATQLSGAWSGYVNDNPGAAPTNWDALINGNYIAGVPGYQAVDGIAAGGNLQLNIASTSVADGSHYYALAEIGKNTNATTKACLQIQKAKGLTAADADPTAFTYAKLKLKGQFGCFNATTGGYAGTADLTYNGAATVPTSTTIMTANNLVFYYLLQ